jgi:hypothetical protein
MWLCSLMVGGKSGGSGSHSVAYDVESHLVCLVVFRVKGHFPYLPDRRISGFLSVILQGATYNVLSQDVAAI